MDIILQLNSEATNILLNQTLYEHHLNELFTVLNKWHATIRAQHPNIDDETLSQFFIVTVPGSVDSHLLNELHMLHYVQAAYVAPQAEAPC